MPTLYEGRDCTITVGSALTQWNKYSLSIEQDTGSVYIPGTGNNYMFSKGKKATLTVDGYRGGDEAFADLVDVGDPVTTITGTDLPSTLVSGMGEWRVTKKSMEQGDEVGTYSLELQAYFGTTSGGGSGSG